MRVLITGGGGFLGTHLSLLLKFIDTIPGLDAIKVKEICILDLREPTFSHLISKESVQEKDSQFRATSSTFDDIKFINASILDKHALDKAFKGVDVVFHCASLVDFGQYPKEKIHLINVKGTENVIEACQNNKIKYLIYTSTTEVASWRTKPNIEMKETDKQPALFSDYLGGNYGQSKRIAEDKILDANSKTLKTCAIRPKGLYGEGDPYYVVNMLQALRQGQLSFLLGSKETKLEAIYVGNVAFAHLFLLQKLLETNSDVSGNAFFVSCEVKKNFAEFLIKFEDLVPVTMPTRYIPARPLIAVAWLFDRFKAMLPSKLRHDLHKFSEQSIRSVVWTQTVCGDKLNNLGFKPLFTEEGGVKRTREWLKSHWLPNIEREEKMKTERSNIKPIFFLLLAIGGIVGIFHSTLNN